jgi:hydrogenase nickel incorporation protein HypA/HybF
MHEQSIVESLLSIALENAEKAEALKIHKISLVVGELSGVLDEAVTFYFNFLSRDTIAAGAVIDFKHVPAQLRCRKCEKVFESKDFDLRCPDCKEQEVDIIAGRELYIDSLEVE